LFDVRVAVKADLGQCNEPSAKPFASRVSKLGIGEAEVGVRALADSTNELRVLDHIETCWVGAQLATYERL
jgi:hypothetical protein